MLQVVLRAAASFKEKVSDMTFYSVEFLGHHKVWPHKQTLTFCLMLKGIASSLYWCGHHIHGLHPLLLGILEAEGLHLSLLWNFYYTSELPHSGFHPHPWNRKHEKMEAQLPCLSLGTRNAHSTSKVPPRDQRRLQLQIYHSSTSLCPFQLLCFLTSVIPKTLTNKAPVWRFQRLSLGSQPAPSLGHLAPLQRHHSLIHKSLHSFIHQIFLSFYYAGHSINCWGYVVNKTDVIPDCMGILMGFIRKEAGSYNKLKYVLQ